MDIHKEKLQNETIKKVKGYCNKYFILGFSYCDYCRYYPLYSRLVTMARIEKVDNGFL